MAVMPKLDVTKSTDGRTQKKIFTKRLNSLFRFAEIDPWKLNNGAREDLLDNLHWAMYGLPRKRELTESEFNRTATPEGISKAQRSLSRFIDKGWAELNNPKVLLSTFGDESEFAGEYYYRYSSDDFATLVNLAFAHLMSVCELRQTDFLACANCGITFVPQRKPRKGRPSYCSFRCANTVAVKNYRARKEQKKSKGKKQKS